MSRLLLLLCLGGLAPACAAPAGTATVTTTGAEVEEASAECSLNGQLHPSSSAAAGGGFHRTAQQVCKCSPGWRGSACSEVALGRSRPAVQQGNWSWGGSPIIGPGGVVHLFVSVMAEGCGLLHYQTNSVVEHYVSQGGGAAGPFVRQGVALGPRSAGHWDSGAINPRPVHPLRRQHRPLSAVPRRVHPPRTEAKLLAGPNLARCDGVIQPPDRCGLVGVPRWSVAARHVSDSRAGTEGELGCDRCLQRRPVCPRERHRAPGVPRRGD
jgi:hypothetical protein